MIASQPNVKNDPIEALFLDQEFLDLVIVNLSDQECDGFGPIDPYLAVYFAYLRFEERRSGSLPGYHPSEHNMILSAVGRIFEPQSS